MTRIITIMATTGLLLSSNALISEAWAGFEFLAPKAEMAPRAEVSKMPPAVPQPIMPAAPMLPPNAYPAAPVMMQPLNNMPAPVAPPPAVDYKAQPAAPVLQMKNTGGLFIDPYPLRNKTNVAMAPSSQSVAQSMAEQSGGLTPVQLGSGMTSGAKAQKHAASAMPRPPMRQGFANGLTPIPGGEPAPLPDVAGIEEAYRNPAYSKQNVPVKYANAVGFGSELPMELALSQIVPSGFTYEIIGKVDKNATVSWEGGEPWNVVLNNMLRTQNMTAVINGDQVTIQPMARL